MPWSAKGKRDAILIIAVIVPCLMLGLGVGGFFLAKATGLGQNSIWVAMVLMTIGLILSILITLKIGKQFETSSARNSRSTY